MKITVDAEALRQVLQALSGPGHYIRELQVTRNLDELMGTNKNPINKLVDAYNAWATDPEQNSYDNAKQGAAANELGKWMSAALADPHTCQEFRDAIEAWFSASKPCPVMENAEIMDAYQAMQEELKWVKDVLAERIGYDGPLAPACCPLVEVLTKAEAAENEAQQWQAAALSLETDLNVTKSALETKEKQSKFAREYAEKKVLEAATYLPKILQLSALLKRARVDVNYSFQMNADLERHQVFTPEDTVPITKAADKYQEFLDEIDAALWVPPTEGGQA